MRFHIRSRDGSGRRNGRGSCWLGWCGSESSVAVDLGLGAFPGYVPGFAAPVAGFAGRVERAAVRCGAVARYVAKLAAGIALHRLCLAVTRVMVRPSAFVAGGRSCPSSVSAAEASISTAVEAGATTRSRARTRASSLSEVSVCFPKRYIGDIRQDGRAGHKRNNDRWCQLH